MCCYRDPKNLERFSIIIQAIIYLTVDQLKELIKDLESPKSDKNENKKISVQEKNEPNENDETTVSIFYWILFSKIFFFICIEFLYKKLS